MGKVEESIERIMQATVRVAFEKGFSNTRTADIAKEAGVSEGLIFKYFPSKKELFAMIIKDGFKRIKEGVEKIIDDSSVSPTSKINALVDFHFKFFTIERNIGNLILGHSERMSLGSVGSIYEFGLIPYVKLIIQILDQGIASGEFRELNTELIATTIIGCMQITLVSQILAKRTENLEEVKRELKEYILSGIRCS